VGRDLVREVSPTERYLYHDGGGPRIAVLDCGVKTSTLAELARRNCRVEVFPAYTSPHSLLHDGPEGVLISNGPGDPAALDSIVDAVRGILGRIPLFGICLGQQIIGLALGGKTYKLKFGHHGANHPVRDARTGKVYITTQNHGFNVDPDTLPPEEIEKTFVNLNDSTLEGMAHRTLPLMSVQFHPEAGPGPHDTLGVFDEFLTLVGKGG
jgi:carbamoyl-phosphate synthase small subunit